MYGFDKITDRRETGSLKWDVGENELPLWVADMDFETAPEITETIIKRAEHGIFGYSIITPEWYDAYIQHWKKHHDFEFTKRDMVFATGVVPILSSAVRKFTTPAEKVVIFTPVYNIFFNSIINNGRQVLECPLSYDREKHSYSIDFDMLEKAFYDPQTSLFLFSNPNNPAGIIWSREELERIGQLADRYSVTVVADEIHCDLCDPGYSYTPFASVNELNAKISITAISPTKAFNIAGLQTSAVVAKDPVLRHRIRRQLNTDECGEPNVFAIPAAVAAFTKGEKWLEEACAYIADNRSFTEQYLEKNIPLLIPVPSHATYLMWVDISKTGMRSDRFAEELRSETGLFVSDGVQYGNGDDHIRINLATQCERLKDGLSRLESYVKKHF
ncbi:MAG: PatB family C-S lyase [Oscillospiraceae bacterium]|nr:PatB family C-S lyase [Oscillospiraceae bacterium]